jgi:pSer/pThr/pTyr-binding forkhead associated (FHA) protein
MFKLVIQDDEGKTTVVPLIRDEITIGRKEGNTIRLTERNVSRRHARILRNNGEVHIEDLGSYNGIRVNNARIAERVSLRVSDQVQIGDYKLYLKAEGVEQVDDARTMPIERLDSTTNTDVMSAVASAPTAPIAIPATPAPGASAVGNPNRTLVAVADTDPQGRPLATAAAVAALSAPVGYGKLVVLSSNFAGKEFELSRPQMIVGRTDENDLVINHRSISRNHAKLVREPDTGRYTISDLQSSNGVRVNGQDYGKVELRRGDVIDLGHVRLRFVEPGEDFVFARDAVITDVPDVGGRKGLLVALLLGVFVLVGVGVFFLTRNKEPDKAAAGSGSTGQNDVVADAPQVAIATPDAPDRMIETPDATGPAPTDDKARIRSECLDAKTSRKWDDLATCTDKLAKFDAAEAKSLRDRATSESHAEVAARDLADAIKEENWKLARTKLDAIKDESVYRRDAAEAYKVAEKKAVDSMVGDLRSAINANCKDFNARLKLEDSSKPKAMMDAVRNRIRCVPVVATNPNPGPGSGSQTVVTPPPCEFADAVKRADDFVTNGNHGAALKAYKQALKCKYDGTVLSKAFVAACNAKDVVEAKAMFPKLPPERQNSLSQACLRYGIDPHP